MASGKRTRRLLFVCTGNTCRSPIAAALAGQQALQLGLAVETASAGVSAVEGMSAAPEAEEVARSRGLSLEGHRSRLLTPSDLDRFDYILTMTEAQRRQIAHMTESLGPALSRAPRLATLMEAAGGTGDINDPVGGGIRRYEQVAEQILLAVRRFLAEEKAAGRIPVLRVALGADHGGYGLKEKIEAWLKEWGYEVEDFGTHTADSVDYPDYAVLVGEAVASGRAHRGVLVCGSGIGMSIAANKIPGIRAAVCHDGYTARVTRQDNDSNVLALGARVLGEGAAEEVVRTWLTTPFAGGRHLRRVAKIEALGRRKAGPQEKGESGGIEPA